MDRCFRAFSPTIERWAANWAARVETAEPWRLAGSVAALSGARETEAAPRYVKLDRRRGVAKSGTPLNPRAANEKIAADLAFRLGLPVPPAILWKNDMAPEPDRYQVISAVVFKEHDCFNAALPDLSAIQRHAAERAISAMWIFETWITEADRGAKHCLVNRARNRSSLPLAFIDYAYAFADSWGIGEVMSGAADYWCLLDRDAAAAGAMLERIEKLDRESIETIIRRIPAACLNARHAEAIVDSLLTRQSRLRQYL